jgi:Spy/CpxP family protein refolding chaperone
MSKKTFLWLFVVCLVLASFTASAVLAQDPDSSGASKGEVLEGAGGDSVEPTQPGDNPGTTITGVPLRTDLQDIDFDNLTTPDGQALPNHEALRQQTVALVNSLTAEQRAQIKAVLDANPPTYMEAFKGMMGNPAETGTANKLALQDLQAMDQAAQQWSSAVNAAIKSVMTPEQASVFDSTVPARSANWAARSTLAAPQGDVGAQTSTDCYYAYYYDYVYTNYYAYYFYLYAYYGYYYEYDPYSYSVYVIALESYYNSEDAYLWDYYAYYYYYTSSYAYLAYYYSTHDVGLGYNGYNFAYTTYTWNGGTYTYYAYLYAYYTWYYAYYYGSYYAYYCYVG